MMILAPLRASGVGGNVSLINKKLDMCVSMTLKLIKQNLWALKGVTLPLHEGSA